MSPPAPRPADFSKRKAVHLHRPDLGCSDVQEKGEKKEQEQDPKHLAGKQVPLRSPTAASPPRHALVNYDSPGSRAFWEM